jgi:hypothetical protein
MTNAEPSLGGGLTCTYRPTKGVVCGMPASVLFPTDNGTYARCIPHENETWQPFDVTASVTRKRWTRRLEADSRNVQVMHSGQGHKLQYVQSMLHAAIREWEKVYGEPMPTAGVEVSVTTLTFQILLEVSAPPKEVKL